MKNLKLAHKMLVLTIILMTSVLAVAFVGANRLSAVNDQIRQLVEHTIVKREVLSELQTKLLSSVRSQKNAILTTDDQRSKEYADRSRALITDVRSALERIRVLTTTYRVEGEAAAVEALGKAIDGYAKLNNDVADLAVQNTNEKAKQLLKGDLHRQTNSLAAMVRTWVVKVASQQNPGPADVARLKTLDEVHAAVLEMSPILLRHIESSSKEDRSAEEKRLTELEDQIRSGLATASAGDPAGQAESRAALGEIKSMVASIIKLSGTNSNNRASMLSMGEAKAAVEESLTRIADLDKLFAAEATAGRDSSAAAYASGLAWIIGVSLVGLVLGGIGAYLLTTRIVTQARNVSESLARSATELIGVSNHLVSQSEHTSVKASSVAGAAEQLTSNINTMAAAAEEMSVNVASISSASEEMSTNVGTISSAAEQTSTNVSVVSTAVKEISSSFADVLKDVREGTAIASDASRMADSATETIQLLSQSGAEISKVTEAIKMIALQTNLLALNATIEATSAGEAGKGFAVVAHEIKELANQSAKAAEDIARKIEGVQNNTRQAVDVIRNVSQIIKDINASSGRISQSVEKQTRAATMISQNVTEANKGVGDIARSIAEVAKAAGDMSRNVAEAAHGATDVSRNVGEAAKAARGISSDIHGVSDASRSTNDSAEKIHESAEQLDKIGKDLRRLVGRVRISTEDDAA